MRVNKYFFFFLLSISLCVFWKVSVENERLAARSDSKKISSPVQAVLDLSIDSVHLVQSSTGRLSGINNCYKKQNCNYSSRDPKEYSIEVGQDLRRELLNLLDRVETQELEGDAISEIGREYIQNQDGYVKEAALLLLSTQAPSRANLMSIVEHVLDYHNTDLVELALIELEKYELNDDKQYIYDAIKKNLMTGSIISRERISREIYSFISEDTYHVYLEVSKSLSRGSIVRKNLEAALEQYINRAI